MTWLVRKIVDFFSFLSGLYYSRKYAVIADRIGREPSREDTHRRGFIIIQVDGLAYEYLLEAMERGYAPHMHRLWQRGILHLARWRCGLPSTTPAVQAGIMFGNNFDVPAFRWYEKDTRTSVLTKVPFLIKTIQDRISQGRPGILRDGSSYVNMVDGDARLALFTLSALGSQRFFENVRGLGFLLLFLLNPWRVLRVVTHSVWDYLMDLSRRVVRLFVPGRYQPFDVISSFLMILTNIVLREIQTFSVVRWWTFTGVCRPSTPTITATMKWLTTAGSPATRLSARLSAPCEGLIARFGRSTAFAPSITAESTTCTSSPTTE